jgi:hypothetical protein
VNSRLDYNFQQFYSDADWLLVCADGFFGRATTSTAENIEGGNRNTTVRHFSAAESHPKSSFHPHAYSESELSWISNFPQTLGFQEIVDSAGTSDFRLLQMAISMLFSNISSLLVFW